MKRYDVIIVGAGMAGMTAGIYAARAGKKVLVFEAGAPGGQIISSLNVRNWPGEIDISGPDLMDKIYHQMNNLSVEMCDEEAIEVKKNIDITDSDTTWADAAGGFLVKTDDGEYSCGAIIIAVGTKPREMSEKQAKSAGDRPVSYCATCDGALYKDRPVVVIGSGNTAKYEMKYLEGICSKVYHIHHDDLIPEEAVAVFVAIGRVPNTEFLRGLVELDKDGYVIADEKCETSCPGVFVAGDCRTKSVRQLVTAAGDGATAAGAAVKYLGN